MILAPLPHCAFAAANSLRAVSGALLRDAVTRQPARPRCARADTIVVNAGIAVTAQLLVTRNLTVQGNGAACVAAGGSPAPVQGLCTLSGGGASRIFKVYSPSAAVTLALSGLALVNGSDVADGLGGGAVLLLPGSSAAASPGLSVSGCVFQSNAATSTGPGGAVAANPSTLVAAPMPMTLTNTSFLQNSAFTAAGAVLAAGPTALRGVTFTGNSATFPYTQLLNTSFNVPGAAGLGFGGALQLASCTGVSGAGLTISGGSFTGNAGTQGGALVCGPGCSCSISGGTTFSGNTATGTYQPGGANVVGSGGAVAALPGSALVVSGATFANNTATGEGGAVWASGNKMGSVNNAIGGLYGFSGHAGIASITTGTSVALSVALATVSAASSTFTSNYAGLNGGAIYVGAFCAACAVSCRIATRHCKTDVCHLLRRGHLRAAERDLMHHHGRLCFEERRRILHLLVLVRQCHQHERHGRHVRRRGRRHRCRCIKHFRADGRRLQRLQLPARTGRRHLRRCQQLVGHDKCGHDGQLGAFGRRCVRFPRRRHQRDERDADAEQRGGRRRHARGDCGERDAAVVHVWL